VRERRRRVPLTEADEPADLPRVRRRSPVTEDDPSPRCVLRDAREGAEIFGLVYWPLALPQITVNLLAWVVRQLSLRPSRFYGTAVVLGLIAWFAH
jgi:hypothetical protein